MRVRGDHENYCTEVNPGALVLYKLCKGETDMQRDANIRLRLTELGVRRWGQIVTNTFVSTESMSFAVRQVQPPLSVKAQPLDLVRIHLPLPPHRRHPP